MTKVGEGSGFPEEATVEKYHKDLDLSSMKFLNALELYNSSTEGVDKGHLKDVMDQQLEIIRASINGLKRGGIYKQEVKVENDYKDYISKGTTESFAALEHDVLTLREYNKLPD